ncbi:MAG: DUF2721 domain-containing protein [Candidatus Methylomirabilales bacterium]|jgi:hypothetical protein|nr:DUF2721 domain-containing protein [candidate division NC10 bacterium]MCH7897427.1 DUF2721 domain-containing protein [candidate division NC10 bacterium]MCZ6550553.1 DUF2721 domain-containing protein [candidate division NC10 bacterium]
MESLSIHSPALAFLTALITPAILILACASVISSCLMRLARVVDRVRTLTQMAEDIRLGKCTDCTTERRQEIHAEFNFYQRRGKVILLALSLLYGTVGLFVATSLAVAVDLLLGSPVAFVPVVLATLGILVFLVSTLLLMHENRLALQSMQREIQFSHTLEESILGDPEGTGSRA